MDGIIQFYYSLKHANNLLSFSYGMVLGSNLIRDDFLALPLSAQLEIITKISLTIINFVERIKFS